MLKNSEMLLKSVCLISLMAVGFLGCKTNEGFVTTENKAISESSLNTVTTSSLYTPSAKGQKQMKDIVTYGRNHNRGFSGGDCFEWVWKYMYKSGYGNIKRYGDLPNMKSELARYFSDYMNASQRNLDKAGLVRIDNMSQPIKNPHDSRIPDGAIVVSAGSYGTAHPTAGDIVIKDGKYFINDGPDMDYGTKNTWYGRVMGVYVPK